jgi:hypothetical protein
MGLNRLELLLGWLAIILACAVVAYTNFVANGFSATDIAPDTTHRFLIGFGAIMLALAIGVTLDGVFDLLAGRVVLALAALALAVLTAYLLDYGFFFWPSVGLAIAGTLLAFTRPHAVGRRA